MALVKSHSNYVLKSKHQTISDGTIYERDITTIGGLNQFSSSSTPIFKSGNFIITVRSDGRSSNEYNTSKFEADKSGNTTWTLETVSSMTSDYEDENETKIVLKQDYYDFCDFAYYGSLSELFRASINDIIKRFPGELYGTDFNVYYTTSYINNMEKIEERNLLGDDNLKALDNPFGIDMHSLSVPSDGKRLRYFANNGYINYDIIDSNGKYTPLTKWESKMAVAILPSKDILDEYYSGDDFYENVLVNIFRPYQKEKYNFLWYNTVDSDGNITEVRTDYDALYESFASGNIHSEYIEYTSGSKKYRIHKNNQSSIEQYFKTYSEAQKYVQEKKESDPTNTYTISSSVKCGTFNCYINGNDCIGDCVGKVKLNGSYQIDVYVGDNHNIEYLYDSTKYNLNTFHIRPNESNISTFYNDSDNFEKILMNRKTVPRYKAIFSVMKENEYGYYREMEEFVFPTTYGDYNLSTDEYGLTSYTKRLVDIGAYYDDYFTDNLYRSMTHESIKNFDWTYTREFYQGDDEEYVEGGEKIQKTLRLFAREFDEIKSYIDAIKNSNRVTYDERSNIPDYFLTDLAENSGWDTILVYPYKSEKGNSWSNAQTTSYSQILNGTLYPYSKKNYKEGYTTNGFFISCCEDTKGHTSCDFGCRYKGSSMNFIVSSGDTYFYDSCANKTRDRIKPYTSEKEYSYKDINNEFIRRLIINSPYILRHKGTIDGIEMILGMFGLKSKRYADLITSECFPTLDADYDITEYSRFAQPYTDKWEDCHMMHTIDWYNSTKTITYDNRGESNYSLYGSSAASDYSTYQGLPVLCRWKDENDKTKEWYLYPNFDKDDELDGNPYFQMNGGWLQKKYNNTFFQFDRDDHIITSSTKLFKETLLSAKRVDNISELLSLPKKDIYDNIVCYVTNIEKDIAILNGSVYNVNYDSNGKKYINLTIQGGGIQVGSDRFFDNDIIVYDYSDDSGFTEATYSLLEMPEGYTIKAYINDNASADEDEFVCKSLEEGPWYFQSFMLFNPTYGSGYTDKLSNYFLLKHSDYNTSLAYYDKQKNEWSEDGWQRLPLNDELLKQILASENIFNGNNPHSGKRNYDNGEEYYEYFKHFFKYACENELFDERCHENFYDVIDSLYDSGFTIESSDTVDNKVHYFGHYKDTNGVTHYYCDKRTVQCKEKYDSYAKQVKNVKAYTLNDISPYKNKSKVNDESLNQIMNNKRLTITFYVKTKYLLEQIKYLDYVVMNYLTQMIPSTTIVDIVYKTK